MESLQGQDVAKILDCRLLKVLAVEDQMSSVFAQRHPSSSKLFTLGNVGVSENGQIKLMSSLATKLLEDYFYWQRWRSFLPETLFEWVKNQHNLHLDDSLIFNPLEPLVIKKAVKQLSIRFVGKQTNEWYLLMLEEQEKDLLSVSSYLMLGLSKREAEVLFKVTQGKENLQIAQELNVSFATVRKHLENIYRKFNVTSRCAAMSKALNLLGILSYE